MLTPALPSAAAGPPGWLSNVPSQSQEWHRCHAAAPAPPTTDGATQVPRETPTCTTCEWWQSLAACKHRRVRHWHFLAPWPWQLRRAICNKSSTHDGVTSCKQKISNLQSMSWKPSSRFFACMFSVPKVTRTSAQLTSAFKSAAGWARFSSCTSTYTAGTATPTPLWRSCILHLSVSLLYHLRRARRTSWQLFVMSKCFWAIEIWHGCHWWSKQHALSSSNSLTSCADNCVSLREPASFHTQQAFTHRALYTQFFTNGKRLHTQQAF